MDLYFILIFLMTTIFMTLIIGLTFKKGMNKINKKDIKRLYQAIDKQNEIQFELIVSQILLTNTMNTFQRTFIDLDEYCLKHDFKHGINYLKKLGYYE
ncbi:MAG: hypothetical protein ACRCTA_05375 [Bacilli bacterium]